MSTCYFVLLILVFLISLKPTLSSSSVDLVQKTCKSTKYYDLCVSSLKSDSTSLKADTKGLATIMIKVGMVNATATNSYLSSKLLLLNTSSNNNTTDNDTVLMKKLLKDCAEKYGFAANALQSSLQDLNDEVYDYAYMHVMAAADYPNVCHNGFKRNPGVVYPPQLAIREDGFKHICDVVLGILDALGW